MKEYSIEDTIIAYFDGRLTDSEGAELLHRVSVSPEIRQIFQEHEALREMSFTAARNISVPSYLDDAVFARVAALQKEERVVPAAFWSAKRAATAVGVLALLVAGVVGTVEYGSGNKVAQPTTAAAAERTQGTNGTNNISPNTSSNVIGIAQPTNSIAVSNVAPVGRTNSHNHLSIVSHDGEPVAGNVTPEESKDLAFTQAPVIPDANISMLPNPKSHEIDRIILPESGGLPISSLRTLSGTEEHSDFEIGLETGSQFSRPATHVTGLPFMDYRFHAGYNLDENDQVGVRLREGKIGRLISTPNTSDGIPELTGSMSAVWTTVGEVYYQRRQPVDDGKFSVIAGVGGGFFGDGINNIGSLLSVDFGVSIPVADRLSAGFTVALSRMHQNGSISSDLLNQGSDAVIYEGDNIRNTINGRLEYGLSYRF